MSETMVTTDGATAPAEFVVHLLSIRRPLLTGCCRRTLRELPKADHVTDDSDAVTCEEMD